VALRFGSWLRSIRLGVVLACLLSLACAPMAFAAYTPATERIAEDFRRDSALSACRHEPAALQAARGEVAADRTQGVPGLLGAIDAALVARNGGACGDDDGGQDPDPTDDDDGAAAAPAPGATPPPDAGATPTPTPAGEAGGAVAPDTTPGAVPTVPGGEGAPTPAPTPAVSATPAPAPARTAAAGEELPAIVWILAGAALLLALLALASFLLSRGRRGDEPLARTGHMWREAGYRFGSAWTDFSEWLRVGR
jgi:hypothetical protein